MPSSTSLIPPPPSIHKPADLLIVGCGNLLRGDDGVGPIMVRHLAEIGMPDGVRLADGGTAGMDVAFAMRGAKHVIIIDACQSDSPTGALFKVPGEELEDLPPITGLHSHAFRWDHALAFGRWLLKDEYPDKVTVYLVEVGTLEYGAEMSPEVRESMQRLIGMICEEAGVDRS